MKSFIFKCCFCLLLWSNYVQSEIQTQEDVLLGNFEIKGYELVSETRITNKIFEYDYNITLKNISGVALKNVKVYFTDILANGVDGGIDFNTAIEGLEFVNFDPILPYQTKGNSIIMGSFDIDETKTSLNTITIRYDRSIAPLKISDLLFFVTATKAIEFDDTKNNHFSVFVPTYVTLADLNIKTNQNPTNLANINTLPFITENFVEIKLPENLADSLKAQNQKLIIRIKYATDPYRLLAFTENRIKWTIFEKNPAQNIAQFSLPLNDNGKVIFALIGEY